MIHEANRDQTPGKTYGALLYALGSHDLRDKAVELLLCYLVAELDLVDRQVPSVDYLEASIKAARWSGQE